MHTAEESRNDYAAQLQKYNKEQNFFYYTEIPQIFNVRYLNTMAGRMRHFCSHLKQSLHMLGGI